MKTNITELAYCLPSAQAQAKAPHKVRSVPSRFWLPGDTYEQALARCNESMQRIQKKVAEKSAK